MSLDEYMEIYHVLNRGVDKRQIFFDKQDYLRFIHDLYVFNNQAGVESTYYKFHDYSINGEPIETSKKSKKLLVDILAFCLMPNHFHLLISPRVEKGMPQFMKKLGIGYAKYFNQKYERVGALFQGRYKQIIVIKSEHFLHLPFYIHLNPLDLSQPEWRENKIPNPGKALEFLESYRWSSHLDYLGIKNFPSVLNMQFLKEIIGSGNDYKKFIENYLKDIKVNSDLALE